MNQQQFDPELIFQWSAARSIARNLPEPVPDFGGHRVDTYSERERRRWVFPFMQEGLSALAHIIDHPGDFIKLCGTASELKAVLTNDWEIGNPGYIMTFEGKVIKRDVAIPNGYVMEISKSDRTTEVRIFNDQSELAASGYAAETEKLFVYDRIATEPDHQRKGLGSIVMSTLRASIHQSGIQELLVATEEGRYLYETLGWKVISPFTSASLNKPRSICCK